MKQRRAQVLAGLSLPVMPFTLAQGQDKLAQSLAGLRLGAGIS